MRSFFYLRPALLLVGLLSLSACRTARLNKEEATDWYARYASMVRWVGYQGSDEQFHYFIARVMDGWSFIQLRRDELVVEDTRPYSTTSSAPLFHYLVDPASNYRKVEPADPK